MYNMLFGAKVRIFRVMPMFYGDVFSLCYTFLSSICRKCEFWLEKSERRHRWGSVSRISVWSIGLLFVEHLADGAVGFANDVDALVRLCQRGSCQ